MPVCMGGVVRLPGVPRGGRETGGAKPMPPWALAARKPRGSAPSLRARGRSRGCLSQSEREAYRLLRAHPAPRARCIERENRQRAHRRGSEKKSLVSRLSESGIVGTWTIITRRASSRALRSAFSMRRDGPWQRKSVDMCLAVSCPSWSYAKGAPHNSITSLLLVFMSSHPTRSNTTPPTARNVRL